MKKLLILVLAASISCDKAGDKTQARSDRESVESSKPVRIVPDDAVLVHKICNQGTPYAVTIYAYTFPSTSNSGSGSYALINGELQYYLGPGKTPTKWVSLETSLRDNPWYQQLKRELEELQKAGRSAEEGEFYGLSD
jgi:hypothetical protein